jgi:Immunoglobulin-like domain of bacterial spore germination/Sporulation and spore germination
MSRDEEILRRVLEAEAARVEVSPDALHTIRARTARRRWLPFGAIALTAATATAATLVVVALLVQQAPRSIAPNPGAATSQAPPPSASPAPSRSSTSAGTTTAALAIYYVADDEGTMRLYREFHRLPAGDGEMAAKVRAAVTEMLEPESALDPDYTTAWPVGVRVRGVSLSGGVATVNLSAAAPGELARQQLVWTVAAVLGGDPSVRLEHDGGSARTLRKAPAVDVLAPVWLIEPAHGTTVGRNVEVHVAGTVFEATAHLRVRRGTTTVQERVLTLSIGAPARGEAKVTLTLSPGTYTLEAYEISAKDGSVQHLDDHTVTVR